MDFKILWTILVAAVLIGLFSFMLKFQARTAIADKQKQLKDEEGETVLVTREDGTQEEIELVDADNEEYLYSDTAMNFLAALAS